LEHVINSFSETESESRVVVDYDRLMQSPNVELAKIAKEFQLQVDDQELEKFQVEFLDSGLRHTVYKINDLALDEMAPPLVQEVYFKALEVASDGSRIEDSLFRNSVGRWLQEFSRLKSVLVLADKLELRLVEREQSVQALTMQVAEKEQSVQVMTSHSNQTKNELEQMKAEVLIYALSRSWRITRPVRKIIQWIRKKKNA
jgi:hypothetical protein